jgi:hypothetical protein
MPYLAMVRAEYPSTGLVSKWAVNPVKFDGKISNQKEWSDAAQYDFQIGKHFCSETPFYNVRLWVKNDANYVYFLHRIEYPKHQWDTRDGGQISYTIGDSIYRHGNIPTWLSSD